MADSNNIKLVYFDARGVIEVARIICKMGNIPFTDERFPIKVVDGNFIHDEFNAYKDTGKLAANMHRAPVLIVGDAVIGQSKSIERYLAKRANFFGNNATEEALIDMLAEHIRDIKEAYGKVRNLPDGAEKTEKMAAWFDKDLGEWLVKLEGALPPEPHFRSGNYCVGSWTSYADICLWQLLRDYFDNKDGINKAAAKAPQLVKIADTVEANPELQAWLLDRPQTMF